MRAQQRGWRGCRHPEPHLSHTHARARTPVLRRRAGPAGDRTRPPSPLGPSERNFARGERDYMSSISSDDKSDSGDEISDAAASLAPGSTARSSRRSTARSPRSAPRSCGRPTCTSKPRCVEQSARSALSKKTLACRLAPGYVGTTLSEKVRGLWSRNHARPLVLLIPDGRHPAPVL